MRNVALAALAVLSLAGAARAEVVDKGPSHFRLKYTQQIAAPPEKVFKLIVLVNGEGFNLVADQDQQPIPKKGESYDFEKLADELKKIKDGHPDKTDIQVASEDTIKFDTLVRTMDAAMTARFPDVSLIDAGGAGI